MPARELTTREQQMSWFNEGKWTLTKRVEQIMTGVHWAEEPLSRVCRLVSNVQLTAIDSNAAGELEVDVSSRFLIYQNRCEYEQYFFVGDRNDRVRKTADGLEAGAAARSASTRTCCWPRTSSIFF